MFQMIAEETNSVLSGCNLPAELIEANLTLLPNL